MHAEGNIYALPNIFYYQKQSEFLNLVLENKQKFPSLDPLPSFLANQTKIIVLP